MLTLQALAKAIGAEFFGDDMALPEVSIDTRTLTEGALFVAIVGPNFDGHDYVEAAIEKGAAVVMVARKMAVDVPQIVVEDTRVALGQLAKVWREQFSMPMIGLTGSCGKTGTKEMIAAILQQMGTTLATQGNLNNDYGVPLTLLRLRPGHQYAVIEMGTNHVGEIRYLTEIAQPTVALITNIRASHLEGLGSFEGVSQEKSDIFLGLAKQGIAVLNHDEAFVKDWEVKIDQRHRVSYALHCPADVTVSDGRFGPDGVTFKVHTPIGERDLAVPLLGEHVLANAVAAITASLAIGASLDQVAQGLAQARTIRGRFLSHTLASGAILIDDAYNASASAVKNAIKTLGVFDGKRIFVMTNMGELGDYSKRYHEKMAEWALRYDIDYLLLYGDRDCLAPVLDQCGEKAHYFEDKAALVAYARTLLGPKTMIIVKGANSHRMSEVVEALLS